VEVPHQEPGPDPAKVASMVCGGAHCGQRRDEVVKEGGEAMSVATGVPECVMRRLRGER
jgi:hypothetical protein